MKHFLLTILFVCTLASNSFAAILVSNQSGGTPGTQLTLEAARTSPGCAGKTITITSALTDGQSNISAAWPADRALEFKKGGSIANSTAFTFATGTSVVIPDNLYVFAGSGTVTLPVGSTAYLQWFGALTNGTTDDTNAVKKAVASGAHINCVGIGSSLSSAVSLSFPAQRISGAGKGTFVFSSSADIEMFQLFADKIKFTGLTFSNTSATHSKRDIRAYGTATPEIIDCLFNGSETAPTGGGIYLGPTVAAVAGSEGIIENCIFNHASIELHTWDVKINKVWIYAHRKIYGIGLFADSGNTLIDSANINPPLLSTAGHTAGIYVTGAVAQPVITNSYIDGGLYNFGYGRSAPGILLENGVLAPVISNLRSNQMDNSVVILDSILNPVVTASTFMNGNSVGYGTPDILVRQTFGQAVVGLRISNNTLLHAAAVSGTPGAAIEVASGVTRTGIQIVDNTITQPGAGGGYTDVEIKLVDGAFASVLEGSLRGNKGSRTQYALNGSFPYLSTDTWLQPVFPLPLAYVPRQDQIVFRYTGGTPALGVNSGALSVSSMGLNLGGTFTNGTAYYKINLE